MRFNRGKLGLRGIVPSPAIGVFLGGVLLSFVCWRVASDRVHFDALSKADAAISDATDSINARLRSTYDVVYGVRGLFNASDDVTHDEFQRYVAGLNLPQRHPTIRAINFSRRVSATEKDVFVGRMRSELAAMPSGYSEFTIRPAGERAEYLPIVYIWPTVGNENAYGIDIFTAERRESAERARDTNEPALSGRLTLATDPTRQPAFSIRVPIYGRGLPIATVDQRRRALIGMLSASFLATNLVGDVLSHPTLAPMGIHLHDRGDNGVAGAAAPGSSASFLYSKAPSNAISAADNYYFSRDVPIEMGGRRWQLRFEGLAGDYMTRTDRLLPWILLVGGLVVSALLAGLIRSLASARERAHTLAQNITADLRKSEAELAEAQRLTHAMIEALPNPIFFKGTDGRYRGVNRAWEKFFGIARGAFIGKTVFDLYQHDKALAERMDALDATLWQQSTLR